MVANVRCAGLMFALDFDGSSIRKSGEQLASEMMYRLLPRGILAMPPKGNTLSFSIPLIIDQDELDAALGVLDDELKQLSLN